MEASDESPMPTRNPSPLLGTGSALTRALEMMGFALAPALQPIVAETLNPSYVAPLGLMEARPSFGYVAS